MHTLTITPTGPYSLTASRQFLCGFTPASGGNATRGDALTLAFVTDRDYAPAAVTLTQSGVDVRCAVHGAADPEVVVAQAARILSLDHDGAPMTAILARDPVLGAVAARTPGFRPVCFASPYEAAVWGVLAQRVPMTTAAGLKRRLAEAHGAAIDADGQTFHLVPSPAAMLRVERLAGLPDEKVLRLHAVARAAIDGVLDAHRLRALPVEWALAQLKAVRGVGEWTAQHILLRGAGLADALPTAEPRVLRACGVAYGLGRAATLDELARASEAWRPLRMWACVQLVADLAGHPAWHGPEPRGRAPAPSQRASVRRTAKHSGTTLTLAHIGD